MNQSFYKSIEAVVRSALPMPSALDELSSTDLNEP